MTYIDLSVSEGVARLYFNRPDKHNAFSPPLLEEFTRTLRDLAARPEVRLLVLGGRGKSFSSGVDLKALLDLDTAEAARSFALLLEEASHALFTFPKPVIARLHGMVLGGALGFAAAADIRVCALDARLGFPAVKLGAILPATCTVYVESLAGRGRTMELTMTGRLIDGVEARQIGLVEFAVSAQELDPVVDRLAARILEGTDQALALTKQTVNFPWKIHWEQVRLHAADNFAYLSRTAEWQSRMRDFARRSKSGKGST
ncbi:MAG: enoyl-CoA hydratase/isomerase family protein [Chlorobi bacterium]|nr:enoyl-CoA hydratase/isomerase family protein [Chlorobiota bacterium]